ncbi:MAG: MFS transporter [Micavibrio sp.]
MTSTTAPESWKTIDRGIFVTIVVAALGYFVDLFDLLLFSIVRVESLKSLGVAEADILPLGIFLINSQMAGLLIGGIVWGMLGDRRGRVSVLLGSILLYSLANIANGFVTTVEQYAVLRFIAGIGLAGELGAGVTLACELLPRKLRGLGTTFIATIGVLGATAAAVIAEFFDWRMAYIIGGVMGLGLLVLRFNVRESGLYKDLSRAASRGNFLILLTRWSLLKKYIAVILVGAPLWGVIGLFITFTPEFAKDFGMSVLPTAGKAVFYCYLGVALGDLFSGLISQYLKSRRKAVAIFLSCLIITIGIHVLVKHDSLNLYYGFCFLIGISAGYWAMFVQMGAEQFGTNIRATAATSVPNFVRALTIPMTAGFHGLIPYFGVTGSGLFVMGVAIMLAFIALATLRETFAVDLDYVEE